MAYADYDYYINNYKSSILSESDFNFLSERAAEFMDSVTFGRLKTQDCTEFDDNIKKCNCELAEAVYKSDVQKKITSESIGEYSVSYAQQTADSHKNQYQIVVKHLLNTGLMYRGL